jgi:hypothetical protein
MRMFRASIDFEIFENVAAHAVMRQHAPYGSTNHTIRMGLKLVAQADRFQATRITGVMIILLCGQFGAGLGTRDGNFLSVDDDDVITQFYTGGKGRLVFAQQKRGNFGRQTAKILAFGIHHKPFTFNLSSLRIVRFVHFLLSRHSD